MSILQSATLLTIVLIVGGLIFPLKLSRRSKLILSAISIVAVSKSYMYQIVGGSAYDPNIPYNLSFVFDLARSCMMFLGMLVIIRAVLNLGVKVIYQDRNAQLIPTCSPFYAQLMVLVAFGLAAFGTSSAYGKPEIKPYEITLERLDPRLDGLKVVMLSDIHVSAPTDVNLIYDMVNTVNALKPDLILMPGDLMDGPVSRRAPITDLFFKLKATYGVYISAGNHEYYSGYQEWREYFEKGGLISLDNKVIALTDGNGKKLLNLGGITDPRAPQYGFAGPDIQGVIDAVDDSAPSIILSHRPQFAPDFANAKHKHIDLVLSGHTHGGLVVGLDRIVARANQGFVSGLYRLASAYPQPASGERRSFTNLIVGNGTMIWMGFPLRLGVPSQISMITLRSAIKPNQLTYMLTAQGALERKLREEALEQKRLAELEQAKKAAAQAASQGALVLTAKPKTPKIEEEKHYNDPRIYKGIQLILPMVNSESGKVQEQLTNVIVLPPNMSKDQMERISAIIQEEPKREPTQEELQQQRLKHQRQITNTVSTQVLKDSPIKAQDSAAPAKAERLQQLVKPSANDSVEQRKANVQAQVQQVIEAKHANEEVAAVDNNDEDIGAPIAYEYGTLDKIQPVGVTTYQLNANELSTDLLEDGQVGNSIYDNSLELQMLYALSLNNSDDSVTVEDLLQTKQGARIDRREQTNPVILERQRVIKALGH